MGFIDKAVRWLQFWRSGVATPEKWLVDWVGGHETKSGVRINTQTAIQCVGVLSCTRIVAETLASLPLKVYERLEDGGKKPAYDHPLYDVLSLNPNPESTSFEWRESMGFEACIWGNHYSHQIPDGKGNVRELWPLDPSRVEPKRDGERGERYYRYTPKDGRQRDYSADEILHISLYGDGLRGYSLVDLCRESIGLAMGAEEFAATFFKNDASPRVVMESEQRLNPKEAAEQRDSWNREHAGPRNRHKMGWTWGGMKMRLIEADLSKLQLVDIRKFQLEEIARIFRVPLHLIQSLDRSTNNNIEHQAIDFVVHTIRPWLVRIEQRMNKSLFGPIERQRYFCEFNVDGLLRGDFVSRTTGYARMIASAMMMPNEGRALENMNPIPGGDRLYIQGAMVPLEQAGMTKKGGAKNGGKATDSEAA